MTAQTAPVEPKLNALNPGMAGALKGGKCQVCSLPLKVHSALDEMLLRGDSVASVIRFARKHFKTDVARIEDPVFYSHRKRHVLLVDRAAAKLSDGQRMQHQRIKLARAVLRDEVDPASYFGPAALAADIAKTSTRLDLAADSAYADGEHASLASLSGQLLRAVELRGKLGGALRENPEVSVNVSLGDLHQRLDGLLGAPADERQNAARVLLGLAPPASTSSPPINTGADADDLANPGSPLTIDIEANQSEADPVPMPHPQPPAALAAAKAADEAAAQAATDAGWPLRPAPFHDGNGVRRPLGPASASNRPMSRTVDEVRAFDEPPSPSASEPSPTSTSEPSPSADAAWRR